MGDIIGIHCKKVFTLQEARDLLPVIRRVTRHAHEEVDRLAQQHRACGDEDRRRAVESQIGEIFEGWVNKVRKLGCDAKGSWLVDFDNGEGYYCWHYPESELEYFHGYRDGFQGRVRIH